ncbi:MAG: polysaccharide deacetylase family protein [Candidatus Eisenbacteria bacterium]
MSPPLATISVDVDPVDLHLVGYGFVGLSADPLAHTRGLPRLIEAFARARVPATLFCVGRDAGAHAPLLRRAAEAGHEIASHTWSHPIRFAGLPVADQRRELADSKSALEAASGNEVVGFRAPNFDMNDSVVPRLAEAGYRYDASAYPTPFLLPARLMLAFKSSDPAAVMAMSPVPFTWKRQPYRWRAGGAEIMQFPVSVMPGLRMPVYHTLAYFGEEKAFLERVASFARRGESLSYVLHAVDAMGLVDDSIDARLAKHPGMDIPLADKIAKLDRVLACIAEHYEVRTYAARL